MLLECLLIPGGIISLECMTNVMCTAGYIMSDSFDAHLVTPFQGFGCCLILLPGAYTPGLVCGTLSGLLSGFIIFTLCTRETLCKVARRNAIRNINYQQLGCRNPLLSCATSTFTPTYEVQTHSPHASYAVTYQQTESP